MSAGWGPLAAIPRAAGRFDGRHDVLDVLVAKQAVLAGVGIQSTHRDSWLVKKPTQRGVGELDHLLHALRPHPVDGLA